MAKKYNHNGDLIVELWDAGYGIKEISEQMNRSEKYIRQLMAQNGIEADRALLLNEFKHDWNRARWGVTGLPEDAKGQDYLVWFEIEWEKAVKRVLKHRKR